MVISKKTKKRILSSLPKNMKWNGRNVVLDGNVVFMDLTYVDQFLSE